MFDPGNDLAKQAAKNGATGVELDLEFSADGIPILMHDDTVLRTTNGQGPLNQLTFSELRKLDASTKHRLRCERDPQINRVKLLTRERGREGWSGREKHMVYRSLETVVHGMVFLT